MCRICGGYQRNLWLHAPRGIQMCPGVRIGAGEALRGLIKHVFSVHSMGIFDKAANRVIIRLET